MNHLFKSRAARLSQVKNGYSLLWVQLFRVAWGVHIMCDICFKSNTSQLRFSTARLNVFSVLINDSLLWDLFLQEKTSFCHTFICLISHLTLHTVYAMFIFPFQRCFANCLPNISYDICGMHNSHFSYFAKLVHFFSAKQEINAFSLFKLIRCASEREAFEKIY